MSNQILGTGNVWPNYDKQNFSTTNQNTGTSLGKDDFLKILITQLQNQDPSSPLEDREFIAQMAQFSTMEQMMQVADEVSLLRQSMGITPDLIGKSIEWEMLSEDGLETVSQSGVVTAITFKNGLQYAVVDDYTVSYDQITKIWQQEADSE